MATYSFSPPTVDEEPHALYPEFLRRYKWPRGIALYLENGAFKETRVLTQAHYQDKVDGVDYFKGGFVYTGISEAVAATLIASGYNPEVEDE